MGAHPFRRALTSTNLTHLAAGLASNAAFFYTFRATNLVEDVWASPSVAFLTAGVHVEATDAVAWEQIANPGAFTVFRPPALTNGDLTVNYTLEHHGLVHDVWILTEAEAAEKRKRAGQ